MPAPQLPLFQPPECQEIDLGDGFLRYYPQWLSHREADRWQTYLGSSMAWQEETIQMFGRSVKQPRLTAWYGDPGTTYTYSGLTLTPQPWTEDLDQLRDAVGQAAGQAFNSVLLNLYRHGQDSMGWHSDDEPELGVNPVIASLSLGESRRFHLRHKRDRSRDQVRLTLAHGSLLIMLGETQHHWQHQVPKTQKRIDPRINLTFRQIQIAS